MATLKKKLGFSKIHIWREISSLKMCVPEKKG